MTTLHEAVSKYAAEMDSDLSLKKEFFHKNSFNTDSLIKSIGFRPLQTRNTNGLFIIYIFYLFQQQTTFKFAYAAGFKNITDLTYFLYLC
jgi:hypothetical protein